MGTPTWRQQEEQKQATKRDDIERLCGRGLGWESGSEGAEQ